MHSILLVHLSGRSIDRVLSAVETLSYEQEEEVCIVVFMVTFIAVTGLWLHLCMQDVPREQ
jgi:hypothetical protein